MLCLGHDCDLAQGSIMLIIKPYGFRIYIL